MHGLIEEILHLDRRPNPLLRFADRYLGIPLVAFLGLIVSKRHEVPKTVRSIGILGNAAIGDTVIASAAIQDVRAALPDAKIFFFAPGKDCADICGMIHGIDEVVAVRMTRPLETVRTIRRHGPYDLWFDFAPWPRANAVVSFFAPASLRIGFETPGQYRHRVYDRSALHAGDAHEIRNYQRLLAAAGIAGSNRPALRIHSTPPVVRRVVMQVIAGGTAAPMKMWPESHWIALINGVTGAGLHVVLTGSGRDRDRLEILRSRCTDPSRIENAAGRLSLRETAELLSVSDAVVSVDTGVMHIAAALDCKLVALFGATSPVRWGPLNDRAKTLYSGRECSPCVSLGLEQGCGSNRCMYDITPDMVMHCLEGMMARA